MSSVNVDHSEVAKFEALASRWWDPDSEFKPLHDINPLRLDFVDMRVGGLSGKRVLDVGCGGGILAESMAERGAEVTGIDMGEAPLAVARLHLREVGLFVDYQHSTAEAFAVAHPGEFDVVTCLEMLEHVPDPASVITACAQLVRPGGHVFFSTINRTPKAWMLAIIGAEYLLRMLPRGTHDYAKFIRPSELASACAASGIELREMTGMHYNPLLRSYHLGPGVDVNYLVHGVRNVQ
ncbi:bifunctional 2-polyprenyl-6-hydroxyphenol methylase/3-demethylubiquinol 3-O-methyltransferase UbiG [Plasticicumulans acidivorans]|uniref:Ubiquinone biosynthesis O-methyltransferase n=1 Tax=Plasticicumulans acidivorans TaxID=886464 RepID=A0A317MWY6_9GAMM|nr:bifunctional 2-polyprenyl-6-hydroxyphenol methylase/3-demethylubiquinol 3-O-methyltransferase UbiG [Plasticicumulans acidivorans]PWV59479.1 3-demethylubiquinone-9 3-methyltransferase [Plasticicumulans acidivorans]